MRIAGAVFVAVALFASGCVTERVKVGCKRAEIYATEKGAAGDTLGAAVGREMGAVNREIGAADIDPATVPLTAEAADQNGQAIDAARETRAAVWAFVKSVAGKAAESWPPLAGLVGALGAAGALFMRLRKYKQTVETVVEGVGAVANRDTKSKIRTLAADYGLLPFLDKIVQRIDPAKE